MPRGVSRLDEARLQRRLWTPQVEIGRGVAWYRLSDPSTLTFSGSNVTGARDLCGRNDLTNAGSGNVTYSAGLGEMARVGSLPTFPGASSAYLRQATIAGPLATATTLQIVALCRTGGGGTSRGPGAIRAYGDDASPFWPAPYADMAARGTDSFLTNATNAVNIGFSSDAWFLWSQQFGVNGFVHEVFRDGAMTATATSNRGSTISASGTRLHVGTASQNQAGECWNGQIAEIVFISGGNDVIRRRAEGAIAWHHGMQHLLPAGHPHRNTPPLI